MSKKPGILIIDDEAEICVLFRRLLEGKGYQVGVATCGDDAQTMWQQNNYQVAMVDLKLPDTDGLTLLEKIKASQPQCEVIIMTGYATTKTAVKAIQMGAFDYIEKPFEDIAEIEKLIERVLANGETHRKNGSGNEPWAEIAQGVGLFYGVNESMHKLMHVSYKIAPKDINVLINGETGTGKEVLARFIHAASQRSNENFVAVNCGAMPENILESHLFGHEKGAFTGANNTHRGIFEMANNGTLFLDEIGEASTAIQVKLLRVLETGEFYRVGGEKPIRTNVRFIAATNVDLEKAVADKIFREDLFYRLDVVRLQLPPLQQRQEDISSLAQYFLTRLDVADDIKLSTEVLTLFKKYPWPGNLRQLFNTIRRAVALCETGVIMPKHLPSKITIDNSLGVEEAIPGLGSVPNSVAPVVNEQQIDTDKKLPNPEGPVPQLANLFQQLNDNKDLTTVEIEKLYKLTNELKKLLKSNLVERGLTLEEPPTLRDMEAEAIVNALTYFNGNITATSRALGVGRNTLYRKAKEYNIQLKN